MKHPAGGGEEVDGWERTGRAREPRRPRRPRDLIGCRSTAPYAREKTRTRAQDRRVPQLYISVFKQKSSEAKSSYNVRTGRNQKQAATPSNSPNHLQGQPSGALVKRWLGTPALSNGTPVRIPH
ncbi:uncharacterized protein RBU33_002861 [Hipposideros larvatus]